MKIALLCVNPSLYANTRLCEYAQKKRWEFDLINPFMLSLNEFLASEKIYDYVITRITGVLKDDFDLNIIEHLEKSAKVMANPLRTHELVRNKLTQYVRFQKAGLSVVPFYSFRGEFLPEYMKSMQEIFGDLLKNDTFIMKPERGNQGKGVNLVRGSDALRSWLETFMVLGDQKWIIQPFVEGAREIRFFLVKDQGPIILEKAITFENFKGNFHQGANSAHLTLGETPQVAIDLAYEAFRMSGAHYASVDLLYKDGKAYLLELNNSPGFKEIESKLNVDLPSLLFSSNCQ